MKVYEMKPVTCQFLDRNKALAWLALVIGGFLSFLIALPGYGEEVRRSEGVIWIESKDIKEPAAPVSLIELIASPDKFHGRWIAVGGFLALGHEHFALYLTRDHREYLSLRDAVWLDFDEGFIRKDEWPKFDNKYVYIIGVFDKGRHGHLGGFAGTVRDVRNLRLIEVLK